MLLVDVGTNAEIVLGNRERCTRRRARPVPRSKARSSRAAARDRGAIERVRIDPATLEPASRSSASSRGRTSRLRRASAAVGVTGVCGSGVIEVIAELFLAGVILRDGTIDGAAAAAPRASCRRPHVRVCVARGRRIQGDRITQNDVRAIQLAKAALHAGVRLLMDHAAITTFDAVRWRGRSATTSIPRTHSCWA
jgi:uncharacterized 2Fe-2S/4Fe-4S cluster protein (DUF4445 family)